ncbi:MAG: hypothetical protein JXA60_12865 [Candidatus Coatesbacteria bacterium]|nr:hypothetical protein [Candidatus Coatesbacteria bacterium]
MKKEKSILSKALASTDNKTKLSCPSEEILCAFVDKTIFGYEEEKVKSHLANCSKCRIKTLEIARQANEWSRFTEEDSTKSRHFFERIPKWSLVAASIIITLGLTILASNLNLRIFNKSREEIISDATVKDFLKIEIPEANDINKNRKAKTSVQEQRWALYKEQFIRNNTIIPSEIKLSPSAKAGFSLGFYQPLTVELTDDGGKQAPFYLMHVTDKWKAALAQLELSAPPAHEYKTRLERINAKKYKDHIQMLRELVELDKEINSWMQKSRATDVLNSYRLGQWAFNLWETGPNISNRNHYIEDVKSFKKLYPKYSYPHIYSCLDRIENVLSKARGNWDSETYRRLIKELALLVGVFQEPKQK